MTESLQRPSYEGEVARLKQRVDALERRLGSIDTTARPELTYVFSGLLIVDVSPRKRSPEARRYKSVSIDLHQAGTTATTVRLLKNGVANDDLTYVIPAGVTYLEARCAVTVVPRSDYLQAQVTVAGTEARHLTFDVWR